jgi:threonine dehydrogenase-like Zn-dependent dehydrogenase
MCEIKSLLRYKCEIKRHMQAVVWHGVGDIRLDEDVAEPQINRSTDAIVRITSSAICGTDLHFVRGTVGNMVEGTILGHEGVGIVENVGSSVRNFRGGDRVVIASTIACGFCSYCRAGYYSQCDNANPNGKDAGTSFYGGPKETGPFNGLQCEKALIPFATTGMVKIPEEVDDSKAIMLSDIFPTGYFGADMARITPGHTVAIFGCGPVGQFAIASAKLMDAGRIFAIDAIDSRLEVARNQGAEVINFAKEDPVQMLRELTGKIGPDCVIDAVGVDAYTSEEKIKGKEGEKFKKEVEEVAPKANPNNSNWQPGNAPSQALEWAVKAIAKAGTLAIIGVYPPTMQHFPIGQAMQKNLKINAGDCHHRKYIPILLEKVKSGEVDPSKILTNQENLSSAIGAYESFDRREDGWMKVMLATKTAAA